MPTLYELFLVSLNKSVAVCGIMKRVGIKLSVICLVSDPHKEIIGQSSGDLSGEVKPEFLTFGYSKGLGGLIVNITLCPFVTEGIFRFIYADGKSVGVFVYLLYVLEIALEIIDA